MARRTIWPAPWTPTPRWRDRASSTASRSASPGVGSRAGARGVAGQAVEASALIGFAERSIEPALCRGVRRRSARGLRRALEASLRIESAFDRLAFPRALEVGLPVLTPPALPHPIPGGRVADRADPSILLLTPGVDREILQPRALLPAPQPLEALARCVPGEGHGRERHREHGAGQSGAQPSAGHASASRRTPVRSSEIPHSRLAARSSRARAVVPTRRGWPRISSHPSGPK